MICGNLQHLWWKQIASVETAWAAEIIEFYVIVLQDARGDYRAFLIFYGIIVDFYN